MFLGIAEGTHLKILARQDLEDVCTSTVCHETPSLLFCFKNALKRRKAVWNVLVWMGDGHFVHQMLQGREERGNLIPALLPGIPRPILEVFSGSDGAQGLSPSVQFQEGERILSCCSQELFLAALTEGKVSSTPLLAAASPAWGKESATLASHTSYKAWLYTVFSCFIVL